MSTKKVRQEKTLIDVVRLELAIFQYADECFTDWPQASKTLMPKKFGGEYSY